MSYGGWNKETRNRLFGGKTPEFEVFKCIDQRPVEYDGKLHLIKVVTFFSQLISRKLILSELKISFTRNSQCT